MALSSLGHLFVAAAFAMVCAIAPSQTGLAAEETDTSAKESADESIGQEAPDPLPANEFFTMAPFIVPIIEDGEHRKQFVLIVAIELEDTDDRDELRRLSPRMRNHIYELLFKIVSFRTIKPRIPPKDVLRARLVKVARRVAGKEMVKSIVIQTAGVADIH